jgi:photosystem II stability/assembly factor-like uncharacterized protein
MDQESTGRSSPISAIENQWRSFRGFMVLVFICLHSSPMESHTYMRTIRTTRPIAPALILSLLLGACGGGDSDGNNGAPGAEGASGQAGAAGPTGASGPAGTPGGDGTPGGKGEQGSSLKWVITNATDVAVNAEPNTSYFVTNNTEEVVVTLPANAQPGQAVRVEGFGQGGWKIAQNDKQTVKLGVMPGETWTEQATDAKRLWAAVASSADGSRLLAAQRAGGLYTSIDGGVTWRNHPFGLALWTSVASSADGLKLVAVTASGQILTSKNGGDTWEPTPDDRELLERTWISVASSGDGDTLVAASRSSSGPIHGGRIGRIYISIDGGGHWTPTDEISTTWTSLTVSGDGNKMAAVESGGTIHTATRVTAADGTVSWTWTPRWTDQAGEAPNTKRAWSAVAYSADGSTLVAADGSGFIYISTNDGETWKRVAHSYRWKTVASSKDGRVLIAAADQGVSAGAPSLLYTSTDGGETWTTTSSTNHAWQSVTASADGNQLFAVEWDGYVHTSKARTTIGVTGSISGTMSGAAELVYIDDGVFGLVSEKGDLTIR